jgi:hypothetical protein
VWYSLTFWVRGAIRRGLLNQGLSGADLDADASARYGRDFVNHELGQRTQAVAGRRFHSKPEERGVHERACNRDNAYACVRLIEQV